MLIALQNARLPLPFTRCHQPCAEVCQSEWFRAHARVDEEERGQKRDFPVVNRRELEKRYEQKTREAARVKEK